MFKLSFVLYELAWMTVFVFALRRAIQQWGKTKTAAFFLPAILFGFLLEWATQTIFQGYRYGEGFLIYALNVPLSVSITWATLLYIGFWLAREKLKLKTEWKVSIASALFLVAVDALHFEPVANTFGYWVWTHAGVWFGAPLSNYYGWFWVVALYLTAFQWIERQKWSWKTKLVAGILSVLPATLVLQGLLKIYKLVLGNLLSAKKRDLKRESTAFFLAFFRLRSVAFSGTGQCFELAYFRAFVFSARTPSAGFFQRFFPRRHIRHFALMRNWILDSVEKVPQTALSSGCKLNLPGVLEVIFSASQNTLTARRFQPASYSPGAGLYGRTH